MAALNPSKMPTRSRLSRMFSKESKESKEKEAEAVAERSKSSDSPPPGYDQRPPDYDGENVLDPPDMTAGFNNLSLNAANSEEIPQVDQTIAHLKVLECFYRLRQKIGATDGLFGIDDKVVLEKGASPNDEKTGQLLAKLAEKRWAIYVSRAVDRFETWSASLFPKSRMIRNADLETLGKEGKLCDPMPPLRFTKGNMPPVDVLMVWHAYMLNPRDYLEDCLRLGRMELWHTNMPWKAAVDCIESESFEYDAGEEAKDAFSRSTRLPWENLDDLRAKQVVCGACNNYLEVPYTTCMDHATLIRSATAEDVDSMLALGDGYCDRDFKAQCTSCKSEINHDTLRVKKFCDDVRLLVNHDTPMGGTILGLSGIPYKFQDQKDYQTDTCRFPNAMLAHGFGKEILLAGTKPRGRTGLDDMTGVRDMVEDKIAERSYMTQVRGRMGRLTRTEKIAIRRMFSRYWGNSSPFALDLVGAVCRQGSFIEKMHNIDWLHSPALPSTMKRLLVKYTRFVSMMKDKYNMAVPTLDVDLAWHTHQLSPYSYMAYTVKATKQFIDHDDKVAETKLNDAFAWTSKTYQKLYGEPYSECTCWYCEAVRESHTSSVSRMFNSSNSQANDKLHDADQDPRKSVHISAHNAVRPDNASYEASANRKAEALEKEYQKACARAQKKGRKQPRRDDYYYSDAWGYPVYIPAYSPYIGYYPFMPMYYPITPGCMAMGVGAAGNCCSGTCGAGVAAGGCASATAGGCSGGAGAGGCGGGAGGCGGGGAGGCGGGGGGGCGGGGGGGCGGGGGG